MEKDNGFEKVPEEVEKRLGSESGEEECIIEKENYILDDNDHNDRLSSSSGYSSSGHTS